MKTFKINLDQMYLDARNPKKHQQKFKRWLLDQKETDEERRERVARDNANIQRIDNQPPTSNVGGFLFACAYNLCVCLWAPPLVARIEVPAED